MYPGPFTIVRLDRSSHGGGLFVYINALFSRSVVFKGSPDFEFLVLSCKSPTNSPDLYLALFL